MERSASTGVAARTPLPVLRSHRNDGAALLRDWMGSLSPRTQQAYARALANAARLGGLRSTHALAVAIATAPDPLPIRALALRFRDARAAEGVAPGTVNQELAALTSLYSYVTGQRLAGVRRLPNPAAAKTRREPVAAMAALVRAAAAQPGAKGVRDRALLLVLVDAGVRRSEAVGLRVQDLELEGPEAPRIHVRAKGLRGARASRALSPEAADALRAWLAHRGSPAEGPVFTNLDRTRRYAGKAMSGEAVRQLLARLSKRAKLPRVVRPHDCRRSGAASLSRAGASAAEVRTWGGWSDDRMPAKYAGDLTDLAQAAARRLAALRAAAGGA